MICRNQMVSIPCFGYFGPRAYFPKYKDSGPQQMHCYAAFVPAKPLQNAVRLMVPATGVALWGINRRMKQSGSRHKTPRHGVCDQQHAVDGRIGDFVGKWQFKHGRSAWRRGRRKRPWARR